MQSLTIEQVVAKMQKSHTQLLHLLTDNLRFASVPSKALEPLVTLKMEAQHREPEVSVHHAVATHHNAQKHKR